MTEKKFPYIIIRLMNSVYQPIPIVFVPDDSIKPLKNVATFVIPDPYDEQGRLTDFTREVIIGGVLKTSKESGFRMCAVFGEADCVYCEPDGSTKWSDSPPMGGMHFEPDGKVHIETYGES